MTIALIEFVERGGVFTRAQAEAVMEELLSGRFETPQIVRLLVAMNARSVDVAELTGCASGMRIFAARQHWPWDVSAPMPLRPCRHCPN